MKQRLLFILAIFLINSSNGYAQKNEMGCSIDLLSLTEPSPMLLYKRVLNNNWSLRSFVGLTVQTDREVRADTLLIDEGNVSYYLSAGAEYKLPLQKFKKWQLYVGIDAFLDGQFIKPNKDSYFGYYYTFGGKPVYGIAYQLDKHLRCSMETRSTFRMNLQEYEAEGENYDNRVSFKGLDQIVLAVGYCF